MRKTAFTHSELYKHILRAKMSRFDEGQQLQYGHGGVNCDILRKAKDSRLSSTHAEVRCTEVFGEIKVTVKL